jgi:hypothetical protein
LYPDLNLNISSAMQKIAFLVLVITTVWGCQSNYPGIPASYHTLLDSAFVHAGENAIELRNALSRAPEEQKEGMAFLISYMPKRDLTSLQADFLLENVEYAYKAREKYSWCAALPDSIFFNEVLPYANISENRDPWRKDFFERFAKYADQEDHMVEAIMSIARNIKDEVDVEYNTKRSKVDSSPKEAMDEHMATCTGLSILLTDAFRSVGIPSRLAGTAMWTNYKGNHTWSEVWVDDQWQFIEYYPDTLNKSWFLAEAGKSDPNNMLHWIYAVSYKPTGMYYYAGVGVIHVMDQIDVRSLPEQIRNQYEKRKSLVQARKMEEPYIWGKNVTQRYLDLYRESIKNIKLEENELWVNLVVFRNNETTKSESRISCRVDVFEGDKNINFGYSPRKTDDMNHFLKFRLTKETEYKLVVSSPDNTMKEEFTITTGDRATEDFQLVLNN